MHSFVYRQAIGHSVILRLITIPSISASVVPGRGLNGELSLHPTPVRSYLIVFCDAGVLIS